MANGAAKDAEFQLVNVTGGTINMGQYLTKVEMKDAGNAIDTTTLGAVAHAYIRGLKDCEVSIEGIFDPVAGTILFNLGTASAVYFAYAPQGTATGKQKYSGSVLLTEYSPPANLDEAVTFTASFKATGAVVVGTY
jgi:hypothetical protein